MTAKVKIGQTLSMSGFRNLKIWQKLGLVVLLLSLPVAFLLYLLVRQQNAQIDLGSIADSGRS